MKFLYVDVEYRKVVAVFRNSEEEIIKSYHSEFKVIPKNISKKFSDKILKLKNLTLVDLNHKELEFLHLQGLLNKDLIKPLYLS